MKKKIKIRFIPLLILGVFLVLTGSCQKFEDDVKDEDGNRYSIVTIGTQVWMAENLKTTILKEGTPIPLVTNNNDWGMLASPRYCWLNNDEASYKESYGALYNFYTVSTSKLCPTGWHVPSADEWLTLFNNVGGSDVACNSLRELGDASWVGDNSSGCAGRNATTEYGFSVRPCGKRNVMGTFLDSGQEGWFWSCIEANDTVAYAWCFNYKGGLSLEEVNKSMGMSIRCIKD